MGRRSVRAFLDRPVTRETIVGILEVARFAPSGGNLQPWHVDVVAGAPLAELKARVRAVLRRGSKLDERPAASYQGTHLMADFDAVSIAVDGHSVRLTRREFELLRYLVQNKNRVVSRDRLLERVWGYDRMVETRSVDVHVGRLRGKLGDAGRQIETVVGLGYRFID